MSELCRHTDDNENQNSNAEAQDKNVRDWAVDVLMSEGRFCNGRGTPPDVGRSQSPLWNTFGSSGSVYNDIFQSGSMVIPPLDYGDNISFSKIGDLVGELSGRRLKMYHPYSSAEQSPTGNQQVGPEWVQESAQASMQEQSPEMVPVSGEGVATADDSFFICQFQNARFNPNGGSAAINNDCGPASLAMAAKAFGKFDPSLPPDALINDARFKMTGANHHDQITDYDQITAGASKYGLHPHYVSFSDLDNALARGEMVIFDGNPGNSYGGRMSSSEYFKYNGGHFMLVTARTANGYLIADPNSKVGLFEISAAEMWDFANWGAGSAGLALRA